MTYRELYPTAPSPTKAAAATVSVPMGLITNVGMAASSIITSILTAFAGASLDTAKGNLLSYFGKNAWMGDVLQMLDIVDIDGLIENELVTDHTFMIDALKAGIGQGVGGLHASLYENWAGVGALLQTYHGTIHQVGIAPYVARWTNRKFLPNIPDAETAWFMHRIGRLNVEQYNKYLYENGWSPDWKTTLHGAWMSQPPMNVLLELYRRGIIGMDELKLSLRWFRFDDDVIDDVASLVVQYPEPYRLALSASKGIINDDSYKNAMAIFGLNGFWADMYRDQNYVYPSPDVAKEMLLRGIIDDESWLLALERSGLDPLYFGAYEELLKTIPPSADLITMVVREAFLPEMVIKAPDVFSKYMAMRGYTGEWSDRYWTAHFLPIPLAQAYDNLRRGYWTKEQFEFALRIADVHPRWYEDIYNVAFNPPSIREMGYGYDVGVYTLEDIKMYRRWGGLSEVDAEKSAVSMVAYRTEAERNAVRTEYMYAYGRGELSREDLELMLTGIGTAPEAVPLWLERAELYKERVTKESAMPEQRMVSSSEALYAFKNGLRDEDWTRGVLADLLWTYDRIELAVNRVKFELVEAEEKVKPVVFKEPSLSLIRDYYRYGYISADEIPVFLGDLNYSEDDSAAMAEIMVTEVAKELAPKRLTESDAEALYDMRLLGLKDNDAIVKVQSIILAEGVDSPTLALLNYYKVQKYSDGDACRLVLQTGIRFAFPDLKAMYSKGWIADDVLVSELIRLGLPKARAAELAMTVVKAEAPARTATEKDFTKSEIIKGWKVGIISTEQAIDLLEGIGYDANEAEYILAINAVVAKADPEGYWEMRMVVEAQKKARGLPSVTIPVEVLGLEKSIREMKALLEKLQRLKASEEEIGKAASDLAGLESDMRRLLVEKKLV